MIWFDLIWVVTLVYCPFSGTLDVYRRHRALWNCVDLNSLQCCFTNCLASSLRFCVVFSGKLSARTPNGLAIIFSYAYSSPDWYPWSCSPGPFPSPTIGASGKGGWAIICSAWASRSFTLPCKSERRCSRFADHSMKNRLAKAADTIKPAKNITVPKTITEAKKKEQKEIVWNPKIRQIPPYFPDYVTQYCIDRMLVRNINIDPSHRNSSCWRKRRLREECFPLVASGSGISRTLVL